MTLTIFLTTNEIADKSRFIWPDLYSLTVLFVLVPESSVHCTIGMGVCPETLSLVILPLSMIDVCIGMDQSTIAT